MKIIGELKEKVDAAQSFMEKKAIIAEAGIQLTDDELTEVSGGAFCGYPDGTSAEAYHITIDYQKSF